ncbi:PQQ-dependent sugar dehydrogenase [Oceanospirillum sediminis]|uniref:PQQ-dependent sugar dehydrogenase n=1 Tax=Oceanospirillum sediminis TaxID=2760088 RepID=A0A839IXY2_9GAMM|nr:PQQ-dependent sugar dehydrogenase [Oceanospirillum sediminis]MBB1489237.1 PQQ-dependent sugar dehydrogenase [Oceanospirillum sediminis]
MLVQKCIRSVQKKLGCLLFTSLVATSAPVWAGSIFDVEKVWAGLEVPWAIQFIDTDRLLVTERQGRLVLLDLKNKQQHYVSGLPEIVASGQGGLLDLYLYSENDAETPWLYFTWSGKDSAGKTRTVLSRSRITLSEKPQLTHWQNLLQTRSSSDNSRHYGSRIAFDHEGYLYMSVGDRGERDNAQQLANHAGSILRLLPDGSVPDDNPFVDRHDALPEIWSYGHRNPQGMAYDPIRNRIWAIEHGPRGGDELNIIQKGANYGWPVISYGKEYWGPVSVGDGTHKTGMMQPEKYYVPSIAPGSLLLYTGDVFPDWKGDLFSGSLKLRHLNHLDLDDDGNVTEENRLLAETGERIRALAQGPAGLIWFSTDSGNIYRLVPGQK